MITHLVDDPTTLDDTAVTIEGDAYRHLFRARRLAQGDRLRIIDGQGRARWSTIEVVGPRTATVALAGEAPANEPAFALQLVVASLRPERASWLVEKATEMGVASVRFVRTERTVRELSPGRLDRLQRVAAAAACQCHRATVPTLTGVHDWHEIEGLLSGYRDRWFLDPEATPARLDAGALAGAVVIGPEGGWSPAEQKALARWAMPVGLGARTLRVETAAVVAAAQLVR